MMILVCLRQGTAVYSGEGWCVGLVFHSILFLRLSQDDVLMVSVEEC
jgi:hypothetical protein